MKKLEIKKIALASLMCALAVVFATVGCIIDIADLVSVTAASALISLSGTELGKKYQILIFAVTGLLLLFLFPAATVTVYFIVFFGYYPIINEYTEKLPRIFAWALKYILFNTAIVSAYLLMTKVLLSAQAESDRIIVIALWITANLFFAVYDFALKTFNLAYVRYYRKKWGIDKFMLR